MKLNCEWTSPAKVATATTKVAFVRTITIEKTEPVAVIGSGTATTTANLLWNLLPQTATSTTTATSTCNASDTEAFFTRWEDPISIPTKIGTEELAGAFSVEIPFVPKDICDAPLGTQQMLIYMHVNGVKTNTLAFEITFVP
jgi:hypothetical protein